MAQGAGYVVEDGNDTVAAGVADELTFCSAATLPRNGTRCGLVSHGLQVEAIDVDEGDGIADVAVKPDQLLLLFDCVTQPAETLLYALRCRLVVTGPSQATLELGAGTFVGLNPTLGSRNTNNEIFLDL